MSEASGRVGGPGGVLAVRGCFGDPGLLGGPGRLAVSSSAAGRTFDLLLAAQVHLLGEGALEEAEVARGLRGVARLALLRLDHQLVRRAECCQLAIALGELELHLGVELELAEAHLLQDGAALRAVHGNLLRKRRERGVPDLRLHRRRRVRPEPRELGPHRVADRDGVRAARRVQRKRVDVLGGRAALQLGQRRGARRRNG